MLRWRSSAPAVVGLSAPKALFATLIPPSAICPVTMGVHPPRRPAASATAAAQGPVLDRFVSIAILPRRRGIGWVRTASDVPESGAGTLCARGCIDSGSGLPVRAKTPALVRLASVQCGGGCQKDALTPSTATAFPKYLP